jgi:hypothetical protein
VLLPRPARGDQSPQAVQDRLLALLFLETANELAGNPPPAASREALAEAREESQATAPLTAETIKPGPYSEHDLRELWNAQSDEEWYELMSYQQLAFAQTQAIEADRRRAEPIAWCRSDDFADAAKKQQSFSGWREQYSDCDMALYGVPVVASRAEIVTGEVQVLAEWLSLTGERAGQWSDEDANRYDRAVALLRQQEADLTTTREALRRLRQWGRLSGGGYSADVVLGVVDWIDGGMTGPLPPLPPQIASREATIEPTPSVSDLPPALVRDGGDGVRISAANLERSCWVVWREIIPDREFLCTDGQWRMEPRSRDFDEAFLIRTRWPSAAAAWDALQRSRAAEGVEG